MRLTTPRLRPCPGHEWVWPECITTDREVEELFQSTWCYTYTLTDPQQIAENWNHLAGLYELTLHTLPREAQADLEDRLKLLRDRARCLSREAEVDPTT
jgi:hypothetical protein